MTSSMISVYSPSTPFVGSVPGGLPPGSLIRTTGVVHEGFCHIDLQTGSEPYPNVDIALHISIRPSWNQVVRNTFQNRAWGTEETDGGCPIRYGQRFELLVLVLANMFKIAINGVHFRDYHHRMSLSSVKYVSVNQQCRINSVSTEIENYCIPAPPYPRSLRDVKQRTSGGNASFVPQPILSHSPGTPTPGLLVDRSNLYNNSSALIDTI
ncbi:galectin-7-like isoform X2 [Sabethes cyaneus]|uniref:galectin-7-like isoform X2 n=1 Tax=Sabethes cyaneus TaxID=53552 RepID=UPI00237EC45F|nr:galectin-7-like isoform X2 [Sabethes cyaneus]